jgi:drug/metabolite transporter (DMT)-like permease
VTGPGPGATNALLAMLCLAWGSTWLAIKLGLRDIPPFTGAALRFVVAGLCMAALARAWAAREGGGRAPFVVMLLHALFQFALNYGLVYVGETVIPSGLVAVLWSVFPLFVALGEHFFLRSQRISGVQWLGIGVSLLGVGALFATDLARVDARAVGMGLLLLLAPASVTISTLLIKARASGSSSLVLNRDAMLVGAGVLTACAFTLESPLAVRWTPVAIASVLYLALVGSVLTFGVYLWLLRYVPAYRMSLVSFVIPVVALLLGAAFGGEPLGATTLFGTGLVVGGVALAARKPRVPAAS